MKSKTKSISILLICLGTILMVLDIIHIEMVRRTEMGMLDFLPSELIKVMFFAYPILFLTSYLLFILTKDVKNKFDSLANVLFLMNGLVVLIMLGTYINGLLKQL